MAFNTRDPIYKELLDRILQSEARVVPFVGAGLSHYGAPGARLPLWRELLERLVDEGVRLGLIPEDGDQVIEDALQAGRYIEATDLILDALGEPTFRRAVERELDDADKPIPPAVTELVAVAWSLIVTTNLDRQIANAYLKRYGRPIKAVTNLDTHKLAAALAGTLNPSETALAQIHGDIDVYSSWRLTKSHYEQLLQDPGYVEALKHLFLRQVFFVGFGLQDDDFDLLAQTISHIYPPGAGEFYALIASTKKTDPTIRHLIKKIGLRPIFYDVETNPDPSDEFGGHRAVYECLAHLAASWAATRTGLKVTLKYFPELDPYVVGRTSEENLLTELIAERGGVIAQVVGLGGSGKTSLVQRVIETRRLEMAEAGYRQVFGCSLYKTDVGQMIGDLALATIGPAAEQLPAQVERICEYVETHRLLLILDGAEAIIDGDLRLRNPYLGQLTESVRRGGGAVVLTTRVPVRGDVFEGTPIVEITPLSDDQVLEFLGNWDLGELDAVATRRLIEVTAGHPLALRVLAGVLQGVPPLEAAATIEESAVIDISDEIDPLRENRLARILDSYIPHLDEAEITFLVCSTAFEGPVSYPLIESALARRYPDTSINAPLLDRDLRAVVSSLIDRRLVTTNATGELSSHPTVREYFSRRAQGLEDSLVPIHRFLSAEYLRGATAYPATFAEASPLLMACRHAAASDDWSLFDDLFRRRLMQGFRNHLCNNLGAWEEGLSLARLGEDPGFPAAGTVEPALYPITVARCLKHLGRSSESKRKYLEVLEAIAPSRYSDTAKYVNNLLTLLIWRGELFAADRMVEVNVRALSWITEPWKRRWQIEHGFSTFAYLRLLQGDLASASALFEHSSHAWDGFEGERLWVYDYYPYYRSELVLLLNPGGHSEALGSVEPLLAIAESNNWPESVCRGHIQAACVYIDRAEKTRDRQDIAFAEDRLVSARRVAAGMNVPDVAIAHALASVKAWLVSYELRDSGRPETAQLEALVERAVAILVSSELGLSAPEVVAAEGSLAYLRTWIGSARERYEEALRHCERQGNSLPRTSPSSIVNWLGTRLGRIEGQRAALPAREPPIEWIGVDMQPDWMVSRLREIQ
jgi:hypothetical protein